MRRILVCCVFLAIIVAACGGKSRGPQRSATPPATSTMAPLSAALTFPDTPLPTSTSVDTSAPEPPGRDGPAAGGGKLFSTLLGGAIGGVAEGDITPGPGDETLKQYLLRAEDLPADFQTHVQTFVVRGPDGITKSGTIDVAVSLAANGGKATDNEAAVVSIAVSIARFNALTETASLLDPARRMTDTEFRNAISTSLEDGESLQDFRRLDPSPIGPDAFGIDWSVLTDYGTGDKLVTTYTFYTIPVKNYAETVYAVAITPPGAPTPTSPDIGQLARVLRARLVSAP